MKRCRAGIKLLMLSLMASGCASTTLQSPRGDPTDDRSVATVTKDMVTVENLLRWPLEGKTGVDKIAAGLKQMSELEEVGPSWFMSEGPVHLADGYILSFAWIKPSGNRIDIGVEGWPCFPPERAMELTGAIQGIIRTDMHGGEHGKEYAVENHGVRLTFGTTPRTYKCVESIYITPALKSNQGTKI